MRRLAVTAVALMFTGAGLLLMYRSSLKMDSQVSGQISSEEISEHLYRKVTVDGVKYTYNTNLLVMLLLGIDAEGDSMIGQADSISLVVFDRGEKRIRMIGISRDSMVPVRVFDAAGNDLGWNTQHLALAYPFAGTKEKGCLLTQEAVSKMFHDIPIVYYAAANISAIPVFHDLVGEITVQVPDDDLKYLDDDLYKGNSLTLTSDNVEKFVRSRNIDQEYSNTGRMRRQKIYMEAYLEKLKILLNKDFSGLVSRMEGVFSNTVTNIGLDEISSFAEMALDYTFDPEQDYYIVQGTDQAGEYHDEFLVDEEALQQLVLQIFYKKE